MNSSTRRDKKSTSLTARELAIFSMLGALMFCSKIIMEALPNIHLLGMLTMTYTLVYRGKALIPLYIYIFLNGFAAGFATWWIPYLYIWTVLWAITMLLPKKLSKKAAFLLYPLVCALHGLAFGTLYAPAQALLFGLNFKQTIAWITAGLPWDALHAASNFVVGFLILPLTQLLTKLNRGTYRP